MLVCLAAVTEFSECNVWRDAMYCSQSLTDRLSRVCCAEGLGGWDRYLVHGSRCAMCPLPVPSAQCPVPSFGLGPTRRLRSGSGSGFGWAWWVVLGAYYRLPFCSASHWVRSWNGRAPVPWARPVSMRFQLAATSRVATTQDQDQVKDQDRGGGGGQGGGAQCTHNGAPSQQRLSARLQAGHSCSRLVLRGARLVPHRPRIALRPVTDRGPAT